MKLRALAPRTQDRYLHAIKAFSEHYRLQPDKITEEQVRKYLLYLIETKGYAKSTFNIDLCAIKFLYRRTLGREWKLLRLKCTKTNKKLPIVLSRGEVCHLPRYVWQKAWVAHSKPAVQGTGGSSTIWPATFIA